MRAVTATLALGLAGLAATSEAPISTWKNGDGATVISYLTEFDSAPNAGAVNGVPVRALNYLGPWNSLYFNLAAINVGQGLAGVKPQSAPIVVNFDATLAMSAGQPSIYADYDGSIVDVFDLIYFYFGCVITNAETVASLPDTCSITIKGFLDGAQVATQDATFTKDSTAVSNMDKVTLNSGFQKVDKVTFAIDGLDAVTDAVLMDNFRYDATLKKGYSSISA